MSKQLLAINTQTNIDSAHNTCVSTDNYLHDKGDGGDINVRKSGGRYSSSDMESDTEVFLTKKKLVKMSNTNVPDNSSRNKTEEAKIPENVTLIDVYRMLATFQMQMKTIPMTLNNLEESVEDVKTRLKKLEEDSTIKDTKLTNLDTGLNDVST